MARKIRARKPKKIRRNPLARALGGARYRPRIVKPAKAYKRRKRQPENEDS